MHGDSSAPLGCYCWSESSGSVCGRFEFLTLVGHGRHGRTLRGSQLNGWLEGTQGLLRLGPAITPLIAIKAFDSKALQTRLSVLRSSQPFDASKARNSTTRILADRASPLDPSAGRTRHRHRSDRASDFTRPEPVKQRHSSAFYRSCLLEFSDLQQAATFRDNEWLEFIHCPAAPSTIHSEEKCANTVKNVMVLSKFKGRTSFCSAALLFQTPHTCQRAGLLVHAQSAPPSWVLEQ